MARQNIEISTPGDGNGDKLYFGGDKINDNFIELYLAEALNTAKVTNATHTGDVTGSGALAITPTGVVAGTYTNATVTVNTKGQVTGISSGAGASMGKYAATVDLNAGETTLVTTLTTEPYSILLSQSNGKLLSDGKVDITITSSGGFVALLIYSFDPLNNCKLKILY
jgi:hypothetical protein